MEIIIRGKQGEGKTTIARRLLGVLRAAGFSVRLEDCDLGGYPEDWDPQPKGWRDYGWQAPEGSKAVIRVEQTP